MKNPEIVSLERSEHIANRHPRTDVLWASMKGRPLWAYDKAWGATFLPPHII